MKVIFGRFRIALLSVCLVIVIAGMAVVAACGGDDEPEAAQSTPNATAGDLVISGGWVRASVNDVAGAYFTVKNDGLEDTLVSAKANVGTMAQLHETVTEGASSKMQEKPGGYTVPAKGELVLEPGGYHVMLMGITAPLSEGARVELTLQFKNAGSVTLDLPVKAGPMSAGSHGTTKPK